LCCSKNISTHKPPYLDFTNVYHMEYIVLIISSSSLQNIKDWTIWSKRMFKMSSCGPIIMINQ
jgi:hypothetical protein